MLVLAPVGGSVSKNHSSHKDWYLSRKHTVVYVANATLVGLHASAQGVP